jgi:hypothetical protein
MFKVQASKFGVSSSVPCVGSMFDVRCSMFGFQCSMFNVRCSMFDVSSSARFLFSLCFLLLISFPSHAQNSALIRSVSGQFLVQDARGVGPSEAAAHFSTNSAYLVLDPTLLAVSAERIKQLINRDLANPAPWRSRIHLTLYPAQGPDSPVTINCESFRDGWEYFLQLPDIMDRREYVRAITQALLLELANRNASARSADIPTWLIEGLTEQLLASSEMKIVLPPPRKNYNGVMVMFAGTNGPMQNPLQPARELLRSHLMLTFDDLSWPTDSLLLPSVDNTESLEVYRRSAQVLVTELLRRSDGQTSMRAMLDKLPQYYNWQFAFLDAFSFPRLLEVEKWWSLHLVHFTQRDVAQYWPADESWQKLDETLRPAVQVRTGTNDIPLHTDVPLQTIVREWDTPRQTQALKAELNELEVLRYRLAPQFVGIADNYHETIQTYLGEQNKSGGMFLRKKATRKHALEAILRELDALDAKRAALHPRDEPVAQVAPTVTPQQP